MPPEHQPVADQESANQNAGATGAPSPAPSAPVAQEPTANKVENFSAQYVKELRQEAASYRTKANDNETALKKAEDARVALEAQLRSITLGSAVERQAASLNIDAVLAVELLKVNAGGVTVEYDEQGQPKDLEATLKALAEKFPSVVGQADTKSAGSGSHNNTPRTGAIGANGLSGALAAHYKR